MRAGVDPMNFTEPRLGGRGGNGEGQFNRMPNMTPELLQVSRVPKGAPEACMRVVRKNMGSVDADMVIEMLGLQEMADRNSELTK
jgi:hypothetical protein